jgi:glycerol-3-phosphate cytidylyltransferase
MKTVITYGTFDLFHIGHLNLLRRASAFGDRLVVAVSTDEFNESKGKKCIIPYKDRAEIVSSSKFVDLVIPEVSWEQKIIDIRTYGISTFVMGDDWRGKFDFLEKDCCVEYIPRTTNISSTDLKKMLSKISSVEIERLQSALRILSSVVESIK